MAVERGKENAQKMRVTDKEGPHILEARAEKGDNFTMQPIRLFARYAIS